MMEVSDEGLKRSRSQRPSRSSMASWPESAATPARRSSGGLPGWSTAPGPGTAEEWAPANEISSQHWGTSDDYQGFPSCGFHALAYGCYDTNGRPTTPSTWG